MKNHPQKSSFIGAAGVYAVASHLSMSGHSVYFPSVDEGADIMLGNGVKIQVKSGHYRIDPRTSGRYYILDVARCKYKGTKRHKTYAGIVDFVIYWAIDENRFFVFPAAELTKGLWITSRDGGFRRMSTSSDSFIRCKQAEDAWHLLNVDEVLNGLESAVQKVTA